MSEQSDKILDRVEKIRELNNKLWMNVLRTAMDSEPERTRLIMQTINENDREITQWLKKL